MNKTFIYGIGNALVDSEYKVSDEELFVTNFIFTVYKCIPNSIYKCFIHFNPLNLC